jgi:hypothetical protein
VPLHALEPVVPREPDHLAAGLDLDVGRLLDAPHQVARHAVGQAVGADQHQDMPHALRQEHRRLTCGVAAADHDDRLVAA